MSEKTIIEVIGKDSDSKVGVKEDKKTEVTPVIEKAKKAEKVEKTEKVEVVKKAENKVEVKTEVKVEPKVETKPEVKPEIKKEAPVIHGVVVSVSQFSYVVRDDEGHGINIIGKHNKKVGDRV